MLVGLSWFPEFLSPRMSLDLGTNCQILSDVKQSPVLGQCKLCGQYWCIELAPDENLSEVVAAKLRNASHFKDFDLIPVKQFLTVLAFGGFGQTKCLFQGCDEYVIGKTALCLKHHGPVGFY
jgi:hypothetical protein